MSEASIARYDATLDDLVLVAESVEKLPNAHLILDDILNRAQVEVDMEVWGAALYTDQSPEEKKEK